MNYSRVLDPPSRSFMLLGPRGTGKSTWLQDKIKASLVIDLLQSDKLRELAAAPERLRNLVAPLQPGSWVVIDEIQKVPALLNEVHWLFENKKIQFAITGSSARKLKRVSTNLLAGRLLDMRFFPLIHKEYKEHYQIHEALEFGTLPRIAADKKYRIQTLASYLNTYLRQEILEEAIVRNLDPFARFIEVAGLYNGQILNKENLARESSVKRPTIDHYFQILEDTLIGSMLPAYRPGLKTKELAHAKFYFFDVGVARACAGLLNQSLIPDWLGFAFETLVLAEIKAQLSYHQKYYPIYHYSIAQSYDIDFVIQTKKPVMSQSGNIVCIEVKLGSKFKPQWLNGLKDFAGLTKERVLGQHIVYMGIDHMEIDGVQIWPASDFLNALANGEIV